MANKLTVKFIVELVGSPKEHVDKTMEMVINKIKADKTLIVKKLKLFESTQIKTLWSTFIEVEAEFESSGKLMNFCFDYMPSSVEIIEPEKLNNFELKELSELMNDLLAKLHKYDLVIKNLHAENILMKRELGKED